MTLYRLLLLLAALSIGGAAQAQEWVGKSVLIKTARDGNTALCIQNFVPAVAPIPTIRDVCTFRVIEGPEPGTIVFEWPKKPGLYLQHGDFRLQLKTGINHNAMFRIVPPLRGNEGVSLQSFNFPTHHVALVEGGQLSIQKNVSEPRKAVFFLQAQPK